MIGAMDKRIDAGGDALKRRRLIGEIVGSLLSIPIVYVIVALGVVALSENGSPSLQGSFIGLLAFAAWTGIAVVVAIAAGIRLFNARRQDAP